MDKISISVRNIVEYAYRSGHLDNTYRSTTRALEGIDVHKKLQGLEGQDYQKEYYLSFTLPYREIQFEITGRADGVFTFEGKHYIDEIKSTTLSPEDIGDGGMVHWGQAYLYAYMFLCLNDLSDMGIRLRYYNVETFETTVLTQVKGKEELVQITNEILEKYHDWAKLLLQSDLLFVDSAKSLDFPYSSYRKGQRKMAVSVYETIVKKKRIFLQAPTGIGKTISTLYPSLKLMGQGEVEKIYYLTARSSAKEVAFDTMRTITDKGVRVKSVLITAKEKICFMEECQCHKDYCPYAENYFDKINGALYDAIRNYDLFSREIIENIAKKHQVCPFELTLEISLYSDVTICDYNYFYNPRVSLRRGFGEESIRTVVLVDEAHNLPDRAREMYSADLVRSEFLEVSRPLKDSWKKVYKSIRGINKLLLDLSKETKKEGTTVIELPESLPHKLRAMTSVLDDWLGKNKGNKYHKEVLDLYFRAWTFISISERYSPDFCCYVQKDGDFRIKIYCMNPSNILAEIHASVMSVVLFSATLIPLRYYANVLGGTKEDHASRFGSPFPKGNFKLLTHTGISLRYGDRERNIPEICNLIKRFIETKKGNYIIFFPSYSFMKDVYEHYASLNEDYDIRLQRPDMKESESLEFISAFNTERGVVAFAVLGGTLSEGIDLTGESLIGAMILGVGIPRINFQSDLTKVAYDKLYGRGYEFAYMYPGYNKVLQASGRVIRTEQDKGCVVLVDDRWSQKRYQQLFPESWQHWTQVDNLEDMDRELTEFWEENKD